MNDIGNFLCISWISEQIHIYSVIYGLYTAFILKNPFTDQKGNSFDRDKGIGNMKRSRMNNQMFEINGCVIYQFII